jgi:hypothetical protein
MIGVHAQPETRPTRVALAVAVPLGLLALGFGLLAISSALVHIGPLDRAQFGWLIAVPIITSVPLGAGLAWRSLATWGVAIGAGLIAISVGAASGVFLWTNVSHPDCQFGSVMSDYETVAASIQVGSISGVVYGLAAILGVALVRNHPPRRAALFCLALGFVTFWVVALLPSAFLPFGMCQRPH